MVCISLNMGKPFGISFYRELRTEYPRFPEKSDFFNTSHLLEQIFHVCLLLVLISHTYNSYLCLFSVFLIWQNSASSTCI